MSPVSANKAAVEAEQLKADEYNKTLTGVGTRRKVGQTRGKNPSVITWDAFDESKPESLPKDLAAFMEVTGVKDQQTILDYVIVGFNDAAYSAASDEIGEFINDAWDKETQAQFRLVVRNYAKATGTSIEDTVALMKPGIDAAFAKKAASA